MPTTRRAILVLGMHRSGTSALARVIGLCGAALPAKTLPSNEYNPTGYWEPADVVRLHDELLSALGSRYDGINPLPEGWFASELAASYRPRLAELLEREYGQAPLWVVKDPRLCRLLPLWRPVLDDMRVAPLAVLLVRSPLEVAASLGAREHHSVGRSFLLWLRHFLEAEAETRGMPRSFVLYPSLLSDWRGVLGKVGRDLALEWPRSPDDAAADIEAFLEPAHRHHVASLSELTTRRDVSEWIKTAYEWALKAARGEEVSPSVLDGVRHALATADLTFMSLLADSSGDRRNAESPEEGAALAQAVEASLTLRGELAAREARLVELDLALAESQAKAEELLRGLTASGQKATGLRANLEESRAEAEGLRAERAARLASLAELSTPLTIAPPVPEAKPPRDRERALPSHGLKGPNNRLLRRLFALPRVLYWAATGQLPARIRERRETLRVLQTGLFDEEWYRRAYPEVAVAGWAPVEHWLLEGARTGSNPNPLFDSDWYLRTNPDVAESETNPFLHYIDLGAAEGRAPNPLFDSDWYLRTNPDVARAGLNPLAHYLQRGAAEGRNPNPFFHSDYYLEQNPDVAASGMNPLTHYLHFGWSEGRDPSPTFDTSSYLQRHPDVATAGINPLAHFLALGNAAGGAPRLPGLLPPEAAVDPGSRKGSLAAYMQQVLDGPRARDAAYRELEVNPPIPADVKAIAFYLPQFHPIPENDEWWGRGFTEWTNVTGAVPQFIGHYQPRLPGELGFYDLRLPEVQRRQVELARNYGIEAFCFHYYWFGGRKLLERPLQQFLADPSLDLGFCVCWANENWSRRWDGSENQVLIAQQHSPEDDLALIQEIAQLFADRRYVRIGGRPVFVVYRVDILPDARATAERWRKFCREAGWGEIFLLAAQAFNIKDPLAFGFDAAVEFPPHGAGSVRPINTRVQFARPGYRGSVFTYDAFARHFMELTPPSYPLIRTVVPAWDNTARRRDRADVYQGSTPEAFQGWLEAACRFADRNPVRGEKVVFINAWNEWAEGAYLEPDRRYGYAYLQATRNALLGWQDRKSEGSRSQRIVIVTHNTFNFGAEQVALNLARALRRHFHYEVVVLDCGLGHTEGGTIRCLEGELAPLFRDEGRLHVLDTGERQRDDEILQELHDGGAEIAICNTVVSGPVAARLRRCGFRVVSLLHELPSLIREYRLQDSVDAIVDNAQTIVCGSELVREGLLGFRADAAPRAVTRHQGLYRLPEGGVAATTTRADLRTRLGLPPTGPLVLAAAYADLRKGFDVFIRVAARLAPEMADAVFVWIGCELETLKHWARHDAEHLGFSERLFLLPRVSNLNDYYAAADLFLLTSREDPFPSVVLEALAHAVPVVAFEGATGSVEILRRGCGAVVPYLDEARMAQATLDLLRNDARRRELGTRGQAIIEREFRWKDYVHFLLEQLGAPCPKVSVVVPNYNYARYLPLRLQTIFGQTCPVYEVIVIDDASTDDSLEVLEQLREEHGWEFTLLSNPVNSGSVFEQWRRGAEAATGDFLWIAEADDYADRDFLASLVPLLKDPEVVLAYSESQRVDDEGGLIAPDYLEYVKDVDDDKWRRGWVREAREELRSAFVVKNTIPNVSAVLSRREAFARVLRDDGPFIQGFRVAGDYACYVRLLNQGGKVAFLDRPLNYHRRHTRGLTLNGFDLRLLVEIGRLQAEVFDRVGASPETARKADRYLQELFDQFGLSRKGGSSWKEHPDLTSHSEHPLYAAAEPDVDKVL